MKVYLVVKDEGENKRYSFDIYGTKNKALRALGKVVKEYIAQTGKRPKKNLFSIEEREVF